MDLEDDVSAVVAEAGGPESLPTLPGLTSEMIATGSSPNARLEDVAVPRRAGYTKQGDLRNFAFQVWSTSANTFYTILVTTLMDRVSHKDDLLASCSCPFDTTAGWCKHTVRCLHLIVDDNPQPPPSLLSTQAKAETKPTTARRQPRPKILRCARCGKDYESSRNRRGSCKMRHPRRSSASTTEEVKGEEKKALVCSRCGLDKNEHPMCFVGTHCAELAAVDAEGWDSSSSSSEDEEEITTLLRGGESV